MNSNQVCNDFSGCPPKKIVFVTGTRADFSKIKSIMQKISVDPEFELYIFATGMHLSKEFGLTVKEIEKSGFKNIYKFINHDKYYQTSRALSATIDGFSKFVQEFEPELIVVHGDRIEPLAAAMVGALENILVAHIEGGEISGTIDDSLRHAITKLSHIHLVDDEAAAIRLRQLGEDEKNIHIIGSADIDLIESSINIDEAKKYYGIEFDNYSIVIFHPVTTEIDTIGKQTVELASALVDSMKNYIIVYPNNDYGFEKILEHLLPLAALPNFKIFPSIRFEYFIALLRNSDFIIGNSSCGLREAPFLGIPSINIGTRQNGRTGCEKSINVLAKKDQILSAINTASEIEKSKNFLNLSFRRRSDDLFYELLKSGSFWRVSIQKEFKDLG